ncbi:type IV pilus twitching motility protein PilT [Parafrigoribacterium soli]|uniref:type IV pilus twitching motility protein PilT n=1 Tax=Parafrigoribacterium soli TaxID=3144663 RepID=UPI0032ECA047
MNDPRYEIPVTPGGESQSLRPSYAAPPSDPTVESLNFPPPTVPSVPSQQPVYVPTPVDESAVFSPIPPESQAPTLRPRGHADILGGAPEQFVHASALPGAGSQSPLIDADPDLVTALQEVVFSGASDLHITNNAVPMLRVDGSLRPITEDVVWNRAKVTAALLSILTPQQQETFATELEFDFAYTISANARFRVNFYQQRGAIGAAFRLIPTEIKALEQLGVPDAVARFATLARGLVLVTGPTGSGKSTTLAALIDLVNRTRADHIVTVEDPIEFLHGNQKSLVNQREVGSDTHSFANALKHVLRQDPDVILIGELRDLETISVALTAAETGHLVFATLHTQDAPQTIDRVIDVFPSHQQGQVRAQLAATLQGVVCQTLVKRAGGKGRAVATEVLIATPAVANLIREGKTYQIPSAMQAGRELGMHTMDQHLAELVNSGDITQEAALEKVHDVESFKRLVQGGLAGAPSYSFDQQRMGGGY